MNRRTFVKTAVAAAAAGPLLSAYSYGRAAGANEKIRVAVAGLNGRGSAHVGAYVGMKDVEIVCLIDPDTRTYRKHLGTITGRSSAKPTTVQDVRKALEDKELNVVSIATTNHWHAPITIWACQAGKDVYVEKPCSHNVHEGRVAVDVARKYDRIVQHGTQNRSSDSWGRLAALAKSGKLGKLLVSRGLCYKSRNSIGFKEPTPPPTEVNFDIWQGPAQERPFHANLVHYNWHWFWDFGNGDIGNQGVHEMDKARWLIPGATLPKGVMSIGGRFGYKDQGETPNTQIAIFDYGETKLVFEVRGLKTDKYYGQGVGNILHFEAGVVAGDKFYPKGDMAKGEPIPAVEYTEKRGLGGGIFGNFIDAVRTRNAKALDADILEGHYSSALCHLANISYRLGQEVPFDGKKLGDDRAMVEAMGRMQEHLGANAVKLTDTTYRLGKALTFDAKTEKFTGDAGDANKLLTREYRKPYTIPEKV